MQATTAAQPAGCVPSTSTQQRPRRLMTSTTAGQSRPQRPTGRPLRRAAGSRITTPDPEPHRRWAATTIRRAATTIFRPTSHTDPDSRTPDPPPRGERRSPPQHHDLGPPPQLPIAEETTAYFPAGAAAVTHQEPSATFRCGARRHRGAGRRQQWRESWRWGLLAA
jgi:hypothetical protein